MPAQVAATAMPSLWQCQSICFSNQGVQIMKYKTEKMRLAALTLLVAMLGANPAWSAGAVIVHPSNSNALSKSDVVRLFLGKLSRYPDGSSAIPIEQKDNSSMRAEFASNFLNKSNQQLKAYWAQQLFTGKGKPPKAVDSSADVMKLVAENPALIGYIESGMADDSVKVIIDF
jgi:ABC-type phosphate transport system substrate-binding protein